MRKKNIILSIAGILILFIVFVAPQHWKIMLLVLCIALFCYLIVDFVVSNKKNKHNDNNKNTIERTLTTGQNYFLKRSLITDREKPYFNVFKKLVEPAYIVQPQINLASIIDKKSSDPYRTELFRNIDFGIFDQDYKPLVLIEINDQSHENASRQERDKKVKKICEDAKIPLIILWTKFGVNEDYIKKRLSEYITFNNDNSENIKMQESSSQDIKGE